MLEPHRQPGPDGEGVEAAQPRAGGHAPGAQAGRVVRGVLARGPGRHHCLRCARAPSGRGGWCWCAPWARGWVPRRCWHWPPSAQLPCALPGAVYFLEWCALKQASGGTATGHCMSMGVGVRQACARAWEGWWPALGTDVRWLIRNRNRASETLVADLPRAHGLLSCVDHACGSHDLTAFVRLHWPGLGSTNLACTWVCRWTVA